MLSSRFKFVLNAARQFFSPTLKAIKVFYAGSMANSAIQVVRDVDDLPLKNEIKTSLSTISSFVGLYSASDEALQLLLTLISTNVWSRMNNFQRGMLVFNITLGLAAMSYSIAVCGQEEHTYWSAVASSTAVNIFGLLRAQLEISPQIENLNNYDNPSRFISTINAVKIYMPVVTPEGNTLTTTFMAHHAIQLAREISNLDLKMNIKTSLSTLSSFVGLFTTSEEAFKLLLRMISTNVWSSMSRNERIFFLINVGVGLACASYAAAVVGQEKHTFYAGLATTAGVVLFAGLNLMADKKAETLESGYRLVS